MSTTTNTTGLAAFAADALAWAAATYPALRVKAIAIVLDDGSEMRLPVPASAFAAQGPAPPAAAETSEVDDAVMGYLRGQRGARMTASQVRDGLERDEKIVYGQSTIERSLAKLRGDGRLTHRNGEGYGIA